MIEDIAQVWKKLRVWKSKTQRKTLGKTLDIIDNKDQNNSLRIFFSKWFSNSFLKQSKDQIFLALETLLNLETKH